MEFGQTVINPLALFFTIIMCVTIFIIKKQKMIIPIILIACFITQQQRIVILSIDFPMIRIILICGFIRILLFQEKSTMVFNKIDKIMIIYIVVKTIVLTVRWLTIGSVIYMLGQAIEILGIYFLVRLSIDDLNDYDAMIKAIIIISIPIAFFMCIEQYTGGRNYFSIFGGVPEFDLVREGRLRATAAFSHPILAGTYGGIVIPFAWGIWHQNKKLLALCGSVCGVIIVYTSSSSGPIMTLGAGLFACFFWFFRKYTTSALKLFLLMIVVLQLTMKAPVWHLISRMTVVGGSTGYHRFLLIDAAIRNFFSWFLIGIKDTGNWGAGLEDVTNQYILEGARGGIITLIFFIIIIVKCFQSVGQARILLSDNQALQKFVWSFGCVMFAHVITFISVSYFGQIVILYFMQVGIISSLSNLPVITVGKKQV